MTSQSKKSPEPEGTVPSEVWIPADPTQRRRRFSSFWLMLAALLALLITLLVGLTFVLTLLFVNSDLIAPTVTVMDLKVGSMTKAEAAAALQERWQEQQILLEHSTGTWSVPVTELGMILDAQATADGAYAQGRTMASLFDLFQGGLEAQPVWLFDAGMAASVLSAYAPQLAVSPVNATIKVEEGRVVELPAAEGRALDLNRTMAFLTADPAAVLMSGRLPLTTESIPPAIDDVSEMAEEARSLLSTAVTLRAYDPITDETATWVIAPESWGSWLTLNTTADDTNHFQWVLDEDEAARYLDTELVELGTERYLDSKGLMPALMNAIVTQEPIVNTRIFHHPRQHVVQSGETLASIGRAYGIPYPWIEQANPGSEFLPAGSTITIPSADEMLPLPVVENKRIVVSVDQQRAWVYEDGELKWDWPVSTGIEDSPTAPGIFQIQSHEPNAYASNWDLWMPSFMGIYRPVPTSDFMNGFHGFPTRSGSNLLWTGDLGRKVTYGCILLSSENAELLYDWAEEGVVVEVQP